MIKANTANRLTVVILIEDAKIALRVAVRNVFNRDNAREYATHDVEGLEFIRRGYDLRLLLINRGLGHGIFLRFVLLGVIQRG
jgi:hypothetical protein